MTNNENKKNEGGLVAFLSASDHKSIGRFLISSSALLLFAALVGALITGYEASDIALLSVVEDSDQFMQLWAASREALIFAALIPMMVGVAVYIVPLQVGVERLAFARGSAAGFWVWLLGTFLFISSYLLNGGPGGGVRDSIILWLLSVAMMLIGLIWIMVCVAATLIGARAQGMSMDKAPYSSWSFFVYCLIGILVLPIIIGEIAISFVRVRYGDFQLADSGQLMPLSASLIRPPFVFWMAIPVLGIGADIIGVHTERPVKSTKLFMMLIGFVGFLAASSGFAFFATARNFEINEVSLVALDLMFVAVTLLVAIPFTSLIRGKTALNPAILGSLFSGFLFLAAILISVIDNLSGVWNQVEINPLTLNSFDQEIVSNDVLAVEAIINYGAVFALIVGSVILAFVASAHHWSVKIWGRQLNRSLNFVSVVAAFIGSGSWAVGQVLASIENDPATVSVGALDNSSTVFGDLAVAGCLLLAASALLLVVNMAALSSTKVTGSAIVPWKGLTLEWATASPPIATNFAQKPIVSSSTPLTEDVFVEPEINQIESGNNLPALERGN